MTKLGEQATALCGYLVNAWAQVSGRNQLHSHYQAPKFRSLHDMGQNSKKRIKTIAHNSFLPRMIETWQPELHNNDGYEG